MSQQETNRSPSLGRLFRELFWPFQTLSWRPVRARDGATELTFSIRLRAGSRRLALRWLALSGCFLLAASVASMVLLMLGGVSAAVGSILLLVDRRTQAQNPEPETLVDQGLKRMQSSVSDAACLNSKDVIERTQPLPAHVDCIDTGGKSSSRAYSQRL